MTKQTFRMAGTLLLTGVIALAGCKGSDGEDGTAGTNGTNGTNCTQVDNLDGTATVTCGTVVTTVGTAVQTTEQCAGCHNAGLPTGHVRANQVALSNVAIAQAPSLDVVPVANADLVVTFNVKVDGVNRNDFTNLTSVTAWVYNVGVGAGTRVRYRSTDNAAIFATMTVTRNFNGNYTVRFPGFGTAGANAAVNDTIYMLALDSGNSQPQATVVAKYSIVAAPPVVSNQACMNCHGSFVFSGLDANGVPTGHHGANPVGVEACIVCHDRDDTMENRLDVNGTRLRGYVHGIHNSHNMPGATKLDGTAVAGGIYYRNFDPTPTAPPVTGVAASSQFSIGFPGFMNNCSTCHDTAAALTAVNSAQVSWAVCMSCHVGPPTIVTPAGTTAEIAPGFAWAGFGAANTGTATAPIFLLGTQNHANFTAATTCATANCHGDVAGTLKLTIGDFHNGLKTARAGLIWDGADQSVVLGETVDMQITGATVAGGNLTITWTAAVGGTPVDPCNATVAAGAPVFMGATANTATGQAASNMSIIRSYAQANDWVNAGLVNSTSPGQPTSVNLTMAPAASPNTSCAANVATTVIPVNTFTGAAPVKGVVGLQGKPQMLSGFGVGTASEVIQVRAKSPTREFVVASGAAPAAADLRRPIVDVAKCKDCHKGSIYQHGGNRVDSTDLCGLCHNPAANEKNVRVNMGITAAEAYDGKVGETYDLRTMVHAIHSAGETGYPLVYYRTNGIYFFGSKAALAKVTNWPGTGCQIVAGSGAPVTAAGPTSTGTQCDATNTTQVTKTHNFIEVHYPQPLSNCGACHVAGTTAVPDPTKAVAVTIDAGGTTYNNQLDDVLVAPVAQSCMTCHQNGDALIQTQLRDHAYENGVEPRAFPNGRQTLIDAAQ